MIPTNSLSSLPVWFVKRTPHLTTLIIVLLTHEIVSAQKSLYTAPFGIQTYTFRRSINTNPASVLDTIKMIGFTEIEGDGGKTAPDEFKRLCDERGLTIRSTGASYEQLVRAPDSVVLKAKALGAQYVMCPWIPHQNGVLTFENAKKAAEDFNKAGRILKDNGLTFCYHTHVSTSDDIPSSICSSKVFINAVTRTVIPSPCK